MDFQKGTLWDPLDGSRTSSVLEPKSKPDKHEVWHSVSALLRERERSAQPEHPETPEPPMKRPALMLAPVSLSDKEEDCIEKYRAEPIIGMEDCPQPVWSKHDGAHSQMACLAHKYLATLATSVPCEGLFSLFGHVVQKKRAALSSKNVNRLVCLGNWLSVKTQK